MVSGWSPQPELTPTPSRTGSITSSSVPAATGTETYTLDALGRLTAVTYTDGSTTTYTYDAAGNRLTKTAGGTTATYTYDDADELIAQGMVTYTYDAAGNLTGGGGSTYTWDYAGRLTGVTSGTATAGYRYDGDGIRTAKTVGTVTTAYLWDRQSGLPLLLDDGSQAYLHAGGVQAQIDRAGTPTYLLPDALGSVRGATGTGGTLTGGADYDVFGAVRGAGGTASAFGFTGEQTDTETGFSFLRARYLDPSVGRFLSADAVYPSAEGTQGYQRYGYVANNPTTYTDPSGHAPSGGYWTQPRRLVRDELLTVPTVAYACAVTEWCRPPLAAGVGFTFGASSGLLQWGGFSATTFTLLACAMDIVQVDAPGPPGIFIRGGDACFETYTYANGDIPDCFLRLAIFCLPTPGGGTGDSCANLRLAVCIVPTQLEPSDAKEPTEADCLPNGRGGAAMVYVGVEIAGPTAGQVTYVGQTSIPIRARQSGHHHRDVPPRLIELKQLTYYKYNSKLAEAIERELYYRMRAEGYRLTNWEKALKPVPSNPCFQVLMDIARSIVDAENLMEKVHNEAPPPGR